MTNKRFLIVVSITLLVLIISIASFLIISNVNDKPPIVVNQNVTTENVPSNVSAEAPIIQRNVTFKGEDNIHWGKGSASIIDADGAPRIKFANDFEVAQGPDLFIYLSPNDAGKELGEYASLGNLKSNSGPQEYILPENYKDYRTVVIWCRAFGVTFATAELN